MTVHDFDDDLSNSEERAKAPWWVALYRHFFPDLTDMQIEHDIAFQERGVDRRVKLTGIPPRIVLVEEKVREEVYTDFALETWSNHERRVPGWMERPDQLTDFLLYVFLPTTEAYLLPFQPLRSAWLMHRDEWIETFPRIIGDNGSYKTISCGVPINLIRELVGFQHFCWSGPAAAIAAGKQWEFVCGVYRP